MTDEFVCWSCGTGLAEEPLPLSRRAECRHCRAELHVCRLCSFFDPQVAESCREERAEFVREKDRANFCDYFTLAFGAYEAEDCAGQQSAERDLAALFGDRAPASEDDVQAPDADRRDVDGTARRALDALFGPDPKSG